MNTPSPIICFGQQPNGFFPKGYLVAKIETARALQKDIGGSVVFFYHDSDSDYRETITLMRDLATGLDVRHNYKVKNKIQKKYSPLYRKEIENGWKEYMLRQLPRFVDRELIRLFTEVTTNNVADHCFTMYEKLGLLKDIKIMRSSDSAFREQASELENDYYADVEYEGEVVRARKQGEHLFLERGGGLTIELEKQEITKKQITPAARQRFTWMQSVINCTHYIIGKGEKEYLDTKAFPDVTFIERNEIEDEEYAWIDV